MAFLLFLVIFGKKGVLGSALPYWRYARVCQVLWHNICAIVYLTTSRHLKKFSLHFQWPVKVDVCLQVGYPQRSYSTLTGMRKVKTVQKPTTWLSKSRTAETDFSAFRI